MSKYQGRMVNPADSQLEHESTVHLKVDESKGESPEDFLPPQYRIIGKVSEGGMGAIYRAENKYTKAQLAIKVLLPKFASDAEALRRFAAEAKAAGSLKDMRICQVHDFGVAEGNTPYLVMDWIDGISLQRKVERDGALGTEEAMRIFLQIAEALEHAHENKVIHRDLKPENIMLTRKSADGGTQVHLVDFGIAKVLDERGADTQNLTRTGEVIGTPLYMSPEQARGQQLDGRSDLYSLGCVMYFALTGHPPFRGESFVDTIYKHINDAPQEFETTSSKGAGLKTICFKAMEKKPQDRYQSMAALASDVEKLRNDGTLPQVILASQKRTVRSMGVMVLFYLVGFLLTFLALSVLSNLVH